ncbi:MAG: AAA family ATPase [Burkholderiales bacterium]|nr:AAA family ATPase [Burkholderiales bacterium]
MLTALAVANYRTLRDLVLPLAQLNVITGANGAGKSNVYRALRLLAETAQGRVVPSLAREGGLPSVLWAGPEQFSRAMQRGEQPVQGGPRKTPVHLRLGFGGDEFGYAIDLGLPQNQAPAFSLDPEIKRECIWNGPILRPSALLVERRNAMVQSRGDDGEWTMLNRGVPVFDSMMTHCADARTAPEMLALREQIRAWRFYDHFRSDPDSPARRPQVGTHTPVLGHDGADLAAAWQTIREIGDPEALNAAVEDAFPGAGVTVKSEAGWFSLEMRQHGLLRPLQAAELSDGTLRYLLWIAALLTPRPPGVLVLNEPETSLHPDLLPALGRLIAQATKRSQVLVVSHAPRLLASLQQQRGCNALQLEKVLGETRLVDADDIDLPAWRWPER